jgi:TolB-like protein/class 3 adenylate cyclase/Tfp pilus assembly protein PilF
MDERMARGISSIATLLAADVADPSRLSAADRPERAQILHARRELFQRIVAEHGGLCHATTGTKMVVEFPTPVDAVRCAVAVQRAYLRENERRPGDVPVLLRIGLSIGEVQEVDGDLRGEGVETAKLLESLAVPGGIGLTRAVREQVRHKTDVAIELAGEREVAGSPHPVAVYQIVEHGVAKGYFSFWAELKRRNVFRVGAAYAVVSWLLIQAASIVFPAFDAPRWSMQMLIALVVLGVPVALALTWIYEITPLGLRRTDQVLREASPTQPTGRWLDRVIIGLLVVALSVVLFDDFVPRQDAPKARPVSIAVLAFRNQSPDANDEYFADGLADELLSALSRVPEFKVASRAAAFYYKGKESQVTLQSIAATLMVDNILSGSVRREGDRIRVTATLDDPVSGSVLWSHGYDQSIKDVLEIQVNIAEAVAAAIVPVLSPRSLDRIKSLPTQSTEAYDFYLQGRNYLRQPVQERALRSAAELFERAITLDARFAHAYAGLCEADIGLFGETRSKQFFDRAETECQRALTLDGSLWETHVALGNLYRTNGQYDQAIAELQTAVAQQPSGVDGFIALARAYAAQGRFAEAEATFERGETVESGFWGLHSAFGNFLHDTGRYDAAISHYVKVTELAPDSDIGYNNLGNLYLSLGRLDEAESTFDRVPQHTRFTYANLGLVNYYRGEFVRAAEDLRRALALAPDYYANWGRLGDAERFIEGAEASSNDAYDTAIRLATNDLTVNPMNWDTMARLAGYYAHRQQTRRARELIEQALAQATDSGVYYQATITSVALGELDSAADYLEKTIMGGWSRALLARDPDLLLARGVNARIDALLAEPPANGH